MSELETLEAEAKLVRSRRDNFKHHAEALREKARKAAAQAVEIDAKADQETVYLSFLESRLAESRAIPPPTAKKPKLRCDPPCGKQKYKSERAAREGTKSNDHRMRVYWSPNCRCYHTTKVA